MTFLWPSMLFTLLVIPLVLVVYLFLQRRHRSLAASFYSLSAEESARRRTFGLRRHLPPLFFLLGLAIILVALARPQAQINLPRVEGTVMLVIDVSASMGATDVEPTRLEAAKAAAREFVLSQPSTVQIGIVSFSNSGFTVQAPTDDTNALLSTIDRLVPTSGTLLEQGILAALNAIAVDAGLTTEDSTTEIDLSDEEIQPSGPAEDDALVQLPEGAYPASVIVLLSDGENNESTDPLAAAQAAAEHEVRIDTLGFGTNAGTTLEVDGFSVHTALDESTLQQIAQAAGGSYYSAQGEQDLEQVYDNLTPEWVIKPEAIEVTSVFAGASALVLIIGSLLSILWFSRLP